MKIIKNDEAVSPVIGVILMVAITVILAAVIAAFVFGMAGTTSTSKNVGLTLGKAPTTGYGTITVNGGTDVPSLNLLEYSVNGGNTWNEVSKHSGVASQITNFGVGQIVYANTDVTGLKLQIRGEFDDGSQQVLLERQF